MPPNQPGRMMLFRKTFRFSVAVLTAMRVCAKELMQHMVKAPGFPLNPNAVWELRGETIFGSYAFGVFWMALFSAYLLAGTLVYFQFTGFAPNNIAYVAGRLWTYSWSVIFILLSVVWAFKSKTFRKLFSEFFL